MTRIPHLLLVKQICVKYNIIGNQHWKRLPHNKFYWTKCKLDILHPLTYMNPCWSLQTFCSHYFFIFMDDFNHHTWCIFFKKRSKTLTIFKTFKEMENNDVGQKIYIYWKMIRAKNTCPRPSLITTTNLKSSANSHKLKCYNIMKFHRKIIIL